MSDLKTIIGNISTLFFIRSHNKYNYIRVLKHDSIGFTEITSQIAVALKYKRAGMYLVSPGDDAVKDIIKACDKACNRMLAYEDLG